MWTQRHSFIEKGAAAIMDTVRKWNHKDFSAWQLSIHKYGEENDNVVNMKQLCCRGNLGNWAKKRGKASCSTLNASMITLLFFNFGLITNNFKIPAAID